jgi:transcriptional regulator with XRE-family HTH domain
MSMGEKLRLLQEKHGFDIKTFAEKIGVDEATLASWESDQSVPSMDEEKKISDLFSLPVALLHSTKTPAPDFLLRDLAKQKRNGVILLIVSAAFFLGFLTLFVYEILRNELATSIISVLAVLLFLVFLYYSILVLATLVSVKKFAVSGDKKAYLAWCLKRYERSPKITKERSLLDLGSAYLDVDELDKARNCMAGLSNPLLLDAGSLPRIELDLDRGNYAEAKGLYLSYISRHRQGRSESETATCLALDGLFHLLAGEMVSEEEKKDMGYLLDSPLAFRILASAPWDASKREGEAVAKAMSEADMAANAKTFATFDAMASQGEHKLQGWLSFSWALSIVLMLVCFLGASLSVDANDSRPLRNMWVLAFAALGGLGVIIFGAIIKKKEPGDHYLPAIIIGSIVMTISILLSLTSLA